MRGRVSFRAAIVAIALIAGLGVAASPPATAQDIQDGPRNYVGPAPCPVDATDCITTTGTIDVVQTSDGSDPGGGYNKVVGQSGSTKAVQTATNGATNDASCTNTTASANSTQTCDVTQHGDTNEIAANFTANPSTGDVVNLQNVTQTSRQKFITVQDGDTSGGPAQTNTLTVTGTIDQSATSVLDASTPVTHTQRTLQHAANKMEAAVHNEATYTLNRGQTSDATGASPTQLQDSSEPEPGIGLGEIDLVANSAGTNAITIRGDDVKSQDANSLNVGLVTQQQGRDGGGWLATLDVDTGAANLDGSPDVDLGTDEDPGLVKDWSQDATAPLGLTPPKDQDQIDDITIPFIGKLSPIKGILIALNKLRTNAGGHALCGAATSWHFTEELSGSITCDIAAGPKAAFRQVPLGGSDGDAEVNCEVNADDECVNSGLNPVSHVHAGVRNADTDPPFGDPHGASTTAEAQAGQKLEYLGAFHNAAAASTTATNANLTIPVPEHTTYVGCSDGCTENGSPVSSVSWGLGNVSGGTTVSRTMQVEVNAGTEAGTEIGNQAGGSDVEEGQLDPSNPTTVTVTAPPPPQTVTIQIQGAVAGAQPVVIFTTPDFDATTIDPVSLRYGDCDDPPAARAPEVHGAIHPTDHDGDGDDDVMTHYDTALTGFEKGDKLGCVDGETTGGTAFTGVGPLPKGK